MPKITSERIRRGGKDNTTVEDLQRLLVASEMEAADLKEKFKELIERFLEYLNETEKVTDEEWATIRKASRGDEEALKAIRRMEPDIQEGHAHALLEM